MGKYFGTDGFRGEANVNLTSAHAYKIGRYLGHLAVKAQDAQSQDARPCIVIGKDTRHSGDMFESALSAGMTSTGCDAHILGVVTTPGVAYLTRTGSYAFGVMISASHNPFYDNGIKVLNCNGEKLEENVIDGIEAYIDGEIQGVEDATRENIGRLVDAHADCEKYADFLISVAPKDLSAYKIGLDCANGSAYALAPKIFTKLGAEVHAISTEPNGQNINLGCGSTHLEALCAYVKENGLDLGFAYDGDADRCLAVDANGNAINGDQIMYVCGMHLKEQGLLDNNTIVATVMSNFGFFKALDAVGIAYEKTSVGDKYVYENMSTNGHMLGGEQSGHIIFRRYATTGDGMMTSLMVMEALVASGKTIAELASAMQVYPQVLKNVRVVDKATTLANSAVQAAIDKAGSELEGIGRILVRQSGTEPLIRVMAEAPSTDVCEQQVDAIIAVMVAEGLTV